MCNYFSVKSAFSFVLVQVDENYLNILVVKLGPFSKQINVCLYIEQLSAVYKVTDIAPTTNILTFGSVKAITIFAACLCVCEFGCLVS